MCSVNEEDLDIANLNLEKLKTDIKDSSCKKCTQEKASVVLRMKDPYCRDCFLKYATHKFRATLGKSKLVRPNDRILLATSGSQSSIALLHLVAAGLSEQNNKRFLFTSLAVYIDEGAVTGIPRDERLEALKTIAQQAEDFSFPCYTLQLSDALNLKALNICRVNSKAEGLNENRTDVGDEQLTTLFGAIKSLTSKEDLLGKLRQNLLIAVAKELHCNKILLADNGSLLAVKLITNISLGRGAHMPWDTGFCDVRDPEVMILRPLKEFMGKEIAFYCVFNRLTAVTLPSLTTKAPRMASIGRLTEDFLFGLHSDFPSTFSAVIKTGDKLTMPSEGQERCILCKVLLDQRHRECSSQQATNFSKELVEKISLRDDVLTHGCEAKIGNEISDCSVAEGPISSRIGHEKRKKEDKLCYGCQLIAADMDDSSVLLDRFLSTPAFEEKMAAAVKTKPLSSESNFDESIR